MDDVKDKMKGLMKNLTPSSTNKFKGQGRVLGSSSDSAPVSRLIPPPNPKPSDPQTERSSSSSNPAPVSRLIPPPNTKSSDPQTLTTAGGSDGTEVAEAVSLYLSCDPPKESVEVMLKLLGNVVREPENDKFRRIRLGNPKIKEAIGDVVGGLEVLESVGFGIGEEGGEKWGTMEKPTKDGVRVVRDAIMLLERWREGGKEESLDNDEAKSVVVEKKVVDRQVIS